MPQLACSPLRRATRDPRYWEVALVAVRERLSAPMPRRLLAALAEYRRVAESYREAVPRRSGDRRPGRVLEECGGPAVPSWKSILGFGDALILGRAHLHSLERKVPHLCRFAWA